jgi:fatty acid desaturase
MTTTSDVLADMAELRSGLRRQGDPHSALFRLSPARAVLDIAFDWISIFGAVAAVVWWSHLLAPLAVLLIANRQRALGNVLHDAGHRNLWRDQKRNDLVARIFIAPLLFSSLTQYRETHFKHHMALGVERADPDLLHASQQTSTSWISRYLDQVFSLKAWLGSMCGHLLSPQVRTSSQLSILGWWVAAVALMWATAGTTFTTTFLLLWLLARATVFHLITTFREMCDHFGLQPGGVFTFTRDIACLGFWRKVIHPRNNGYHLTHHLLPAVPYYRLPEAHRLLKSQEVFQGRATVCSAYFTGPDPVTRAWQGREYVA